MLVVNRKDTYLRPFLAYFPYDDGKSSVLARISTKLRTSDFDERTFVRPQGASRRRNHRPPPPTTVLKRKELKQLDGSILRLPAISWLIATAGTDWVVELGWLLPWSFAP